ncbi:MAG TPA: toxin-antitoxin system YwqK family antitoxin [Flavobacteriia bacterium]|jgi:antitoxin component YwqK of YwqJK toxin-antitoxin module|nr:toxin-antitoxin system YwqK family antitoxin [Flavobacteriia bacterium]
MKNYIFSYVFIFIFSITAMAQKDTIWYDANWNNTIKDQASYYRTPIQKKGNGYLLTDYYISGNKQMVAFSLEPNEKHFHGNIIYYFENGNIWQEAEYKDGVLHGIRKRNYESGKVKNVRTNVDGKIHGKWTEYYENGQIKEMGNYQEDEREGLWKEYYKSGKLKAQGNYKDGKKVGDWNFYYYDGTEEEGNL